MKKFFDSYEVSQGKVNIDLNEIKQKVLKDFPDLKSFELFEN